MEFLKIPELLTGEWENLLILTYGSDIAFFENFLWRQFSNRCRNKIILADADQFLKACKLAAENGTARLLNHRYILDGIHIPHSAHAKFILLTNHDEGRLLVGSGNLGIDGYASGGELFTHYEYSNNKPGSLPAFVATWEFVQELVSRRFVSEAVVPYIQHILSQTPWLLKSGGSDFTPVIHNLKTSFLSQIRQIVGSEPVQELWIMSPFYDEKCEALRQLIQTFSPKEVRIYVQQDRTSMDPKALEKVLSETKSKYRINSIEINGDQSNPYIHAKLYLFKTKEKSICIQGSPNLSQVAMLLSPPAGNIEVANLGIGNRNDFDSLFDNLLISPEEISPNDLDFTFNKADLDLVSTENWYLIRAILKENILILNFGGTIPPVSTIRLQIGEITYPIQITKEPDNGFLCHLPDEAIQLLSAPVPITVILNDSEVLSNPVFVWNQATLNREMLEVIETDKSIEKFGGLDVVDEELERLLAELEAALVIDGQSIWQLAGRPKHTLPDNPTEEQYIDYSEIDYDQLRHHPKIIQYTRSKQGDGSPISSKTRLQMILDSITDHFNGLGEPISSTTGFIPESMPSEDGLITSETEEEQEKDEVEKQKRRKSARFRLRKILKNFIKRYINGIQSQKFQELAGFSVMARNYVIFTHFLWQLFGKDWLEDEYIVESFIKIWRLFWGEKKTQGYYHSLDQVEQVETVKVIHDHHNDGLQIASLYYGASLSWSQDWEELRFALRDFLRYFMENLPFEISQEVLTDAWSLTSHLLPYSPPIPSQIVDELVRLSNFENKKGFLRTVELEFGFSEGSCSIERITVYRQHLSDSAAVECLVVNAPTALKSLEDAITILNLWRRYRSQNYYRISSGDSKRLFFYDFQINQGVFYNKENNEIVNISELPPCSEVGWVEQLRQIKGISLKVDESISLAKRAIVQSNGSPRPVENSYT